ncbi:MAG: hypothetical protein HYU52_05385 [Acidobacteria bacterium]|nr:hypothetical protein [Acidobacteriota bacterium]
MESEKCAGASGDFGAAGDDAEADGVVGFVLVFDDVVVLGVDAVGATVVVAVSFVVDAGDAGPDVVPGAAGVVAVAGAAGFVVCGGGSFLSDGSFCGGRGGGESTLTPPLEGGGAWA